MDQHALFGRALAYARESGDASCAGLQRNLLIGYNTALELHSLLLEQTSAWQQEASTGASTAGGVAEPFFQPCVGAHYLRSEHPSGSHPSGSGLTIGHELGNRGY